MRIQVFRLLFAVGAVLMILLVVFHTEFVQTEIMFQKDVILKTIRVKSDVTDKFNYANKTESRYIVYTCFGRVLCGGWSDRISGMLTSFLLSKLLGYKYGVLFTKPCDINLFFSPNTINWTIDERRFSNMDKAEYDLFCSRKLTRYLPTMHLTDTFNKSVNYVYMNWDYRLQIMSRRDARSRLPWLYESHEADIYRRFYQSMFTPTDRLTTKYRKFRDSLDPLKTMVCAHVRIEGGHPDFFPSKYIGVLWKHLQQFKNSSNTYIYIATNNATIKSEGKQLFPDQYIDMEGSLTHIDNSNSCEGYETALLEFTLLTKCDTIILTKSGFGITAAYIRNTSKNMYCLTKNGVESCSRYTLEAYLNSHLRAPLS